MAIFGAGDGNEPSAVEVLEEVQKHLPLYLLVDLVEAHYRSRRNKLFMSAVGILSTLTVGSGATIYTMYTNYDQQAETRTQRQIQASEDERARQEMNTDRLEARQRTATRIDFVRSLRSFGATQSLPVGTTPELSLSAGERRQFKLATNDDNATNYRIGYTVITGGRELVMYLYRRGDSAMAPVDSNNRRGNLVTSITFPAEDGAEYYLEIEELIGDPGDFRLTLDALG